jgi:hypothetical protein
MDGYLWKWTYCILGPFVFARNVDGNAYLDLLNDHIIPQLIELFNNQYQDDHFQRLGGLKTAPQHTN